MPADPSQNEAICQELQRLRASLSNCRLLIERLSRGCVEPG
jgi:hypothetical protein